MTNPESEQNYPVINLDNKDQESPKAIIDMAIENGMFTQQEISALVDAHDNDPIFLHDLFEKKHSIEKITAALN